MTPIRANGVLKRHTEQISQTYIFGRDIRHWYVPSGKEFLLKETFALNLVLFFFSNFAGVKFREGNYQMCFSRANVQMWYSKKRKKSVWAATFHEKLIILHQQCFKIGIYFPVNLKLFEIKTSGISFFKFLTTLFGKLS